MENKIAEIEKGIERLRKNLDQTSRLKARLELTRSDLLHFIKMAEQNLKYLKKKNIVFVMTEYKKIARSHRSAKIQIDDLEKQIRAIGFSIDKLRKNLDEQTVLLEALKKAAEPKVLQFKRK